MASRSPFGIGIALAVIVGAFGVLGFYHKDDFSGPAPAALTPEEKAFLDCRDARAAGIQKMVDDGAITKTQQEQFLSRAEALCRSQAGGGSQGPSPPEQ